MHVCMWHAYIISIYNVCGNTTQRYRTITIHTLHSNVTFKQRNSKPKRNHQGRYMHGGSERTNRIWGSMNEVRIAPHPLLLRVRLSFTPPCDAVADGESMIGEWRRGVWWVTPHVVYILRVFKSFYSVMSRLWCLAKPTVPRNVNVKR